MFDAISPAPGLSVLDVACGTGCLARHLSHRLGRESLLTGMDCNEDRLALAASLDSHIHWNVGKAECLPYRSGSFDLVLCQFGLMFFQNPVLALEEMRRVCRRTGRVVLTVWDRLDRNTAFEDLDGIYARYLGAQVEADLREPYRFGDPGSISALLEAAGLPDFRIATECVRVRFESIGEILYADTQGWMASCGIKVPEGTLQELSHEAERALSKYATADGIEFSTSAHIITIVPRISRGERAMKSS